MRQTWTGDQKRPVSLAYIITLRLYRPVFRTQRYAQNIHKLLSVRFLSSYVCVLVFLIYMDTNLALIWVSNIRIIGKFIFSLNFEYILFSFRLSRRVVLAMLLTGLAVPCHPNRFCSVLLFNQLTRVLKSTRVKITTKTRQYYKLYGEMYI